MKNILPLWTAVREDEPAHGVLIRLAEINGFLATTRIRTITGVRPAHLRIGRDLDRLARVLKCDPATFEASTPIDVGGGQVVIRGERLSVKNDLDHSRRRVCPACLKDSSHQRFWWDLSFVTSCPGHGLRLSEACTCGQPLSWGDTRIDGCRHCADGRARRSRAPVSAEVVEMERWILGRFGVGPSPASIPIVGSMGVSDAIDTLGRIGALDLGGYRTRWAEPRDFGREEVCRARGFAILASGGLDDLFDRIYGEFLGMPGAAHPTFGSAYGWFWHWFNFRKGEAFSLDLAKALVSNASRKFQIQHGTFPRAERELVSDLPLNEAARQVGVRHGTLRKLLAREGKIRNEKRKGSPLGVALEDVRRLKDDLADSIPLSAVAEVLGVGGTIVRKLNEAGALPVWVKGGRDGEKHRYLIRRSRLDAWVDEIVGKPNLLLEPPPGTVLLGEASLRTNVPILAVIEAIRDGRLPVVGRLRGKPLFAGALLPKDSVVAARPPEVQAKLGYWTGKYGPRSPERWRGVAKGGVAEPRSERPSSGRDGRRG